MAGKQSARPAPRLSCLPKSLPLLHVHARVLLRQRLLDANGKLEEGDRVWLSRLRGIMSVSQFEGERALESVTAPIYR